MVVVVKEGGEVQTSMQITLLAGAECVLSILTHH